MLWRPILLHPSTTARNCAPEGRHVIDTNDQIVFDLRRGFDRVVYGTHVIDVWKSDHFYRLRHRNHM